jgi:DNA invertase Pin-like site-specific DNA recombinase
MIAGVERRYVAYYRASTGQQRESGLGLESQRGQVRDYVKANHGLPHALTVAFIDNALKPAFAG